MISFFVLFVSGLNISYDRWKFFNTGRFSFLPSVIFKFEIRTRINQLMANIISEKKKLELTRATKLVVIVIVYKHGGRKGATQQNVPGNTCTIRTLSWELSSKLFFSWTLFFLQAQLSPAKSPQVHLPLIHSHIHQIHFQTPCQPEASLLHQQVSSPWIPWLPYFSSSSLWSTKKVLVSSKRVNENREYTQTNVTRKPTWQCPYPSKYKPTQMEVTQSHPSTIKTESGNVQPL